MLPLRGASINLKSSVLDLPCNAPPEKPSQPNDDDDDQDEVGGGGGGVISTQRQAGRQARGPKIPSQTADAMAVPPRASTPEEEPEDGEFTFPTPPPPLLGVGARCKDLFLHPAPASASACSSPPVWLLSSSSSPIRRSFSAADCAASPWRDRRALLARLRDGGRSPALSDYAGGFCEEGGEEDEERMDSLWEDLNDDDDDAAAARGEDIFFGRSIDVSRRSSVAANAAEEAGRVGKDKDRISGGSAVLGASRSSRRRPPGLVAMMRGLRRMFVAHKAKSRVHRDEQSTASASASAYSLSRKG